MHVVLVEDNQVLAKSIVKVLKKEDYNVTHFGDGQEALFWLELNTPAYDAVILDVLLPGKNGFEICKAMRVQNIIKPILMLTSKGAIEDTVEGLNSGADDYLKKPFVFEELLARLRALMRRPEHAINKIVALTPSIDVDTTSHKVIKEGKEVELTAKEFSILLYFLHHPNKVINQQELYDHVFDYAEVQLSNTIEVHIKNLRKKLRTKNHEIPIKTIRGAGYRLDL